MTAFGFDFGTTNSLISFIAGNRPINVLDDGFPFPSVVCYLGDKKIVGREAKKQLADAGASIVGNTVRSPKSLLGKGKIFVEGVARNPQDIVADIVSYVRQAAIKSEYPGDYDTAVVTIPIDMNGRRRAELRDAFRTAGISVRQFVHEPLAALYGHFRSQPKFHDALREYDRELILVFDWGGGTLDLTLCQVVDGMLVQVKNDGCSDVGGDYIDAALRNHVMEQVSRKNPVLAQAGLQPQAREKLLARAESAKIELSSKPEWPVYVSSFFAVKGDPDFNYELKREELEGVCKPFVDKAIRRIEGLLDASGVSAPSVVFCLATGGMVNMPLIQSRLLEYFGPQRLKVSEHSATVIAEGAAWIAHDQRQLSLAKNIELRVAVNSYMSVIPAGTQMPREREVSEESFDMYCTDARDGHAKFQLCAPVRAGKQVIDTDDRNELGTLTVKIHAGAEPFMERLRFNASIDENLILKASAFSTMQKDLQETEVHNLEFGLRIGPPDSEDQNGKRRKDVLVGPKRTHEPGSISLRANISRTTNRTLIPGDLLAQMMLGPVDPNPFDTRINAGWATARQQREKLYYQPCAICRRAANDPRCRCASGLTA